MGSVPKKIEIALEEQLFVGEHTIVLLKTAWKPTATIPIVWLAVTNRRCFLFSTLRGSHLFKAAESNEINSALKEGGNLRILFDGDDEWNLRIDPAFAEAVPNAIAALNTLHRLK